MGQNIEFECDILFNYPFWKAPYRCSQEFSILFSNWEQFLTRNIALYEKKRFLSVSSASFARHSLSGWLNLKDCNTFIFPIHYSKYFCTFLIFLYYIFYMHLYSYLGFMRSWHDSLYWNWNTSGWHSTS